MVQGDEVVVRAQVSNTGPRDGVTVVQCYVEMPKTDLPRPVRELKGFQKIHVKQGGREAIEIRVPRSDLTVWDVKTRAWRVMSGEYKIVVGQHARDLGQSATVTVR